MAGSAALRLLTSTATNTTNKMIGDEDDRIIAVFTAVLVDFGNETSEVPDSSPGIGIRQRNVGGSCFYPYTVSVVI